MRPATDMAGQRIGDVTVLSRAGTRRGKDATWLVAMPCGHETVVTGHKLRCAKGGRVRCPSCSPHTARGRVSWGPNVIVEPGRCPVRICRRCANLPHRRQHPRCEACGLEASHD